MLLRHLGLLSYQESYTGMQLFTAQRNPATPDEIWLCEHLPVFTQGLAGQAKHLLFPSEIPVIETDRGGQITYHGPGQIVAYPLLDLKRAGYFVKEYVYRIEEALIATLRHFGVTGHRVLGAPGIYVRLDDPFSHAILRPAKSATLDDNVFIGLGKIAALGIKVSRHCTYHGLSLNVAMDLKPFAQINPCGYSKLQTVDLSTIGVQTTWADVASVLSPKLITYLTPNAL